MKKIFLSEDVTFNSRFDENIELKSSRDRSQNDEEMQSTKLYCSPGNHKK